jgi:5-methyltetrahydropteroyltriglutamate--homocysteine methyltransferase
VNKLFPTQEIGSLSKPAWRVKGCRGLSLTKREIKEALEWGRKLGIENLDKLAKLLSEKDSIHKRQVVLEWSARYAIKLLEFAGLDIVFDGEQWRSEMYEHVARSVRGFSFLGMVKSFDFRYYNKAVCVGKPRHVQDIYLEEFLFTRKNTDKIVKIPFTGPYTLACWTFNEYYEREQAKKTGNLKQRKLEAKQAFLLDLVKNVVRPEIRKLIDAGARWIQIDEPAATTFQSDEEMTLFVDSFNETVKGFNSIFSLHNCYSNYKILAKYAGKLRNCNQLALEFANRDDGQIGRRERSGYCDLQLFEKYGFRGNYGVGVIDVHTDLVESPKLVRERILYAAKMVGDPSRIYVSTDCGLRTKTWKTSYEKLRNMVLGAEMARRRVSM